MSSTGHAHFFVYRKDETQRSVCEILLNQEQGNSNGHAVVGTEARPISGENPAIPFNSDRVFQRIIGTSRLSNTDHVHMALYNRQRHIFISFCRRYISNNVIDFILYDRSSELTQTGCDIITDFFFMA